MRVRQALPIVAKRKGVRHEAELKEAGGKVKRFSMKIFSDKSLNRLCLFEGNLFREVTAY